MLPSIHSMFPLSIRSPVLLKNKFILSSLPFLLAGYFASHFSKKFERTRRKYNRLPHLPTYPQLHPHSLPFVATELSIHPSRATASPTQMHPSSKLSPLPCIINIHSTVLFTQLHHQHTNLPLFLP